MIRRHRYGLVVAALGIVAAACGGADVAATVNDTTIENQDVSGIRTAPVEIRTDGEAFRSDLTTLIIGQATLDAAEEDYGITGLDTDAGRQAFLETASDEELGIVTSIATNPDLTTFAVEVVTTQLAVRAAVRDAIAQDPEVLERVWTEQQQFLIEVCGRHVLVATEDEALAAKARIDDGEAFATVAADVSLDPVSIGGELPCPANPVDYVEPFSTVAATAPVGELTVPFETEFGWHILIVDVREFPESYEEFAEDATRWVPDAVLAGAWANWRDGALGRADISVRSQIGTWFPQGDGILPPPSSP